MEMIQPLLAVLLVLGLLCGALWFLRNRGAAGFQITRSGGSKQMEVLERVSLGPHHALHLVRVGDQSLLVATSASAAQILEPNPTGGGAK
jgi:flagellar biosynthetic protein FliO